MKPGQLGLTLVDHDKPFRLPAMSEVTIVWFTPAGSIATDGRTYPAEGVVVSRDGQEFGFLTSQVIPIGDINPDEVRTTKREHPHQMSQV